ncbi:MAG: Spy/CpxP family protein refolding chaperone [Ferruginibacter sp.]
MINTQNKSKVFVAIIVILMIANIALVSFFLLKKDNGRRDKHEDRKAMIANFLKNEIGFSTGQLQRYDTLSNQHRDNIRKMFDSLRSSKDKQFKQLSAGNFSDSVMNTVAEQSAVSQKMMELQMFNHLKNIRLLCTPEQLPRFDSLFPKVLNKRGGDARKKEGDKR